MDAPCPDVNFPGRDKFIATIDRAVERGDIHAITLAVRNALTQLIRDPEVCLPDGLQQAVTDHYARRELYRSPQFGYSVIAMTWGPGQGAPLHDHGGLWCVEGVWQGELDITQYELLETRDDRYRFRAAGGLRAGPGSAGSLIPPHEYHTIGNANPNAIAISLHIYQSEMIHCTKFHPQSGEWFVRESAELVLDTVT